MKGYKVFNPDWTCKGFKYAVGETFSHNGEIGICEAGFHFCTKITDCFNYYSFDCNNKVAEIEATGKIITDGDKSVTDVIKIVREISWYEVLDLSNEGRSCTGRHNTGNFNSGECNAGNYNSGDFNSCDFSNGFFNSVSPPVYAFNKPLNVSRTEFLSCSGVRILNRNFKNTKWGFSFRYDPRRKKYMNITAVIVRLTVNNSGNTAEFTTAVEKWLNFNKKRCRKMPRLKKSEREKFLECVSENLRICCRIFGAEKISVVMCVSVRTVYGRIEKPTRFNNGLKYVVTVSVAVMPVQLPV